MFFPEGIFAPLVIFAFALVFYATSLQERCWYRRYIIPALFMVLAVLNAENFFSAALLLVAAVFIYYGYRGYGRQAISAKNGAEGNEESEKEGE